MTIIRWTDRLRAFSVRVWRVPYLVEFVALVALLACLLCMSSCGETKPLEVLPLPGSRPTVENPLTGPTAPPANETAAQGKLRELQDGLATAERHERELQDAVDRQATVVAREHRSALVAPIRTTGEWGMAIGALITIAGIGCAVASVIWTWSFGWKACLGIAGIGAAATATSVALVFAADAAVDHPWWTVGSVAMVFAAGIGAGAWIMLHGRKALQVRDEIAATGQDGLDALKKVAPDEYQAVIARAMQRQSGRVREGIRHVRQKLGLRQAAA